MDQIGVLYGLSRQRISVLLRDATPARGPDQRPVSSGDRAN